MHTNFERLVECAYILHKVDKNFTVQIYLTYDKKKSQFIWTYLLASGLLAQSLGLLLESLVISASSMVFIVSASRSMMFHRGTCTSPRPSSLEKVSLSYTWNTIVFLLTSSGFNCKCQVYQFYFLLEILVVP